MGVLSAMSGVKPRLLFAQFSAMGIQVVRAATTMAGETQYHKLFLSTMAGGSAAILVLQLLLVPNCADGLLKPENLDPSMTWREEEGVSVLVPVHPKRLKEDPLTQYTMAEVAQHNKEDDLWIVVDERVYDVTKFLYKHPGNFLPLLDMGGKDCTDAFENYHAASVYGRLTQFLIGEVTDVKVGPAAADFREARQQLLRRGLFKTDLRFYSKHASWLSSLFFFGLWRSLFAPSTGGRMLGAASLGLFWQQLAGMGHDLGHSGVSHQFYTDHFIGSCCTALMGLSTCWWKKNHNVHHVMVNSVENDPDIQHMPFIAVSDQIFEHPFWSTYYCKWVGMDLFAKLFVGSQHFLWYILTLVFGRFNIYRLSWRHLFLRESMFYRKLELTGMTVFAGWVLALANTMPTRGEMCLWLAVSHIVSGLLHIQIVISHWAMPTYHETPYLDESNEWNITQIRTCMNVDCYPWLDWVHIGLQFQMEHHLYPRLPRHSTRAARDLVRAVCEKHGIHYHEKSFWEANVETTAHLRKIALIARRAVRGPDGYYRTPLEAGDSESRKVK